VGETAEDYLEITPFNEIEYYHPYCEINNWEDQEEVEDCWLFDLCDLNQTNTFVHTTFVTWIKNFVETYSIDGLRIDTVEEVPQWFWADFQKAAGIYAVGEVFNGDYGYVGDYQNYLTALLDYPEFFTLRSVMIDGSSMYNLRTNNASLYSNFNDPTVLGQFVDNHDNERFLGVDYNINLYKCSMNFILGGSGIPIIYYGSEQYFIGGSTDDDNREPLWGHMNTSSDGYIFLQTINQIRKSTQYYNEDMVERYVDDSFYAWTRGEVFFAITNQAANLEIPITYHPYADGTTLCNAFWPTDCVTVSDGAFPVYLNDGETKIFMPQSSLYEALKVKNSVVDH